MNNKKELKDWQTKSSKSWRMQEKGKSAIGNLAESLPEHDKKLKFGPYVRLSPTGEEREEGSLVSHPQRIENFIKFKNDQMGGNWGGVVDWYIDKDYSGKDMNRPSFQRLCQDIEDGKINAVIVTELSRLSRSVKDFCQIWDFFQTYGVTFFSLKENFDTSTPMGELMLIQAMSFSQFERHTIVDRIKRGAKARAERGLANGVPPLGYDVVEGRANHRQVNEDEKLLLQLIFKTFLELGSLEQLVDYLNKTAKTTKKRRTKAGKWVGGAKWTSSSLHSVLTNRSYIGEREVNKSNRSVDPRTLKSDDRYYFVDACWEAIIERKTFFDVQERLMLNKKKARKYTHNFILTHYLYCSECGEGLIGKSGHGRNGKHYYYGHKRKKVSGPNRHLKRCKVENIAAFDAESVVIGHLEKLSRDKALLVKLVSAANEDKNEKAREQKRLNRLKIKELQKLSQKVENLIDLIAETSDAPVRESLKTKLGETIRAKEATALEFKLSSQLERETQKQILNMDSVFALLRAFRKGFREESPSVQALILKDIIRQIIVHPDKLVAEFYSSATPSHTLAKASTENAGKGKKGAEDLTVQRSLVRTAPGMVGGAGIEPTTFTMSR